MTKSVKRVVFGSFITILIMVLAFVLLYQTYIQDVIYKERLSQMEEVTHQMFHNLEDVMDSKWNEVSVQCNRLLTKDIQTLDEFTLNMEKSSEISNYSASKITLIGVDTDGKYYTKEGSVGLLRDCDYLLDDLDQISYVSSSMMSNSSQMVFLKKLDEPLYLERDHGLVVMNYYGMYQDMSMLNAYFGCDAYDKHNSVYVLDNNGFKLFNGNEFELIKGHNVFNVLKKMEYLHNSSFEETQKKLNETGSSYSNAILDGTEYFYALKQMDNTQWTLLFLVPAKYVATNTVKLVNFVIRFIIVFSIVAASCYIFAIVSVLKKNQREAIQKERENTAKLETINGELRQAKQAAEQAFEVARDASQSKSVFLANMSHDIRTPMNAIVGMTALIEHDADNEEKVREYARKIDVSSKHLLGIINDVLDMSKIETGQTTLNNMDFSISEMIQEVNAVFRPQTSVKYQSFVITSKNIEHKWVNGDVVHLTQILNNLLSNAIKYTHEGGKIQLIIEECESHSNVYAKYRIQVIDNGMGMSDAFKEKIFDAFTREENSMTNKIQGTGLGMAITKNLIEAMGGTIDVESIKGKGSCFTILLDLKIAKETTMNMHNKEKQDVHVLKGMNFLCAEDNVLNAEILCELLKIEGATCTICEDGQKVLDAFKQSKPQEYDVILMDVQMPNMNGYEATKAIRNSNHSCAKTIPIIAMTANAFSEDIQKSLAAGMNAHVSKPVEMKVLEKTILNILVR